jgi:hypothetical protein
MAIWYLARSTADPRWGVKTVFSDASNLASTRWPQR